MRQSFIPKMADLTPVVDVKSAASIQVLLVDDHVMFREGMADMLGTRPGVKVVGQCSTSADALARLPESGANLVLLDIALGTERALDFVMDARRQGFKGHILVVTAGVSPQEAVRLIQAGAAGILHKQNSTQVLCSAIEQVANGKPYLESQYLAALFQSVGPSERQLTRREKSVLSLVARGLTNAQIGVELGISEGAAKSAMHELFKKLGVHTRAQLIGVALEQYKDQL